MGQDYYLILLLTRSAEYADIKKAYRKLALQYHPLKNHNNQEAEENFKLVAEAYDVLSEPRKRGIYDHFGEEGLKNGIPADNKDENLWTQGYTFHGDADKVFSDFFGGDNPFIEYTKNIDSAGFGGFHGRGAKRQDPNIERDLAISLEEVYYGCIKKMQIARRVMNEDGHTSSTREKILTVCVKKGWKPGTRITFPKEGDQGPNITPADIVFILIDKTHPRFKRQGHDLVYTAKVALRDALVGCTIEVRTLDERFLSIPINNVIAPGYTKMVPREGMPIVDSTTGAKGDLIIEFDIEFPNALTPDKKELVKRALSP